VSQLLSSGSLNKTGVILTPPITKDLPAMSKKYCSPCLHTCSAHIIKKLNVDMCRLMHLQPQHLGTGQHMQ
jgi:hypothetical protein